MSVREGLQMMVGGARHLGQPIVHLVSNPAPLLFLARHELADKHPKQALAFGQLRGALRDPLLEGLVETPDLLLGPLALGDVLKDDADPVLAGFVPVRPDRHLGGERCSIPAQKTELTPEFPRSSLLLESRLQPGIRGVKDLVTPGRYHLFSRPL